MGGQGGEDEGRTRAGHAEHLSIDFVFARHGCVDLCEEPTSEWGRREGRERGVRIGILFAVLAFFHQIPNFTPRTCVPCR